MATITERPGRDGKPSYRARVKVKGHKVLSKTFTTKTAAKTWAKSQEVKLKESPHLAASEAHRHTLADAIDRYLSTAIEGKALSTQRDILRRLGTWKLKYGDLTLAALTPARLSEARDDLLGTERQRGGGPLAPATVKKQMAVLSHVMTLATKEWQWAATNPFDNIRSVRVNNERDRYLSDDELKRLLRACEISESADLRLAVLLTLTTGARQMEVMGLPWKDVDLASATVTFRHTKNKTHRAVGLVPELVAMLRERPRGIGAALVFPSPHNPAKPIDLRSAWETALRRAEIEDFRWHDLRHTAASYLAMEGASAPEIAAVLGHKTLAMVKRYAHLSPQHTARVATKIGKRVMGGADEVS